MGAAYSIDLRERVLLDLDAGMSKVKIACKYRVSTRWIYNLQKQREETGDIAPRRGKTGPKPKLEKYREQLLKLIEERPDASLQELRDLLGVSVGLTTLWHALRRLGVTFKKSAVCR